MRVSCMCTAIEVVRHKKNGTLLVNPRGSVLPENFENAGFILPEKPMTQTIGMEQYLSDEPNLEMNAKGEPRQHYPNFDLACCGKCGALVAVGA